MKKVAKIMALILAAALVLSLIACGGDGGNGGGESTGGTIKIFANFSGDPNDPGDLDKILFDAAEEATGVKVEWELPPTSGYAERLQIMMASGEYPDVVLFPSLTDQAYRNAIESGIVLELNDYLTPELAPNILEYTYDTAWDAVKYYGDDRIMALPRTSLIRNEGNMIRQDWAEKIGMGEIFDRQYNEVDIDEFRELCRRFTTDDPDGNGKNDTFGFGWFADPTTKQFGPIDYAYRVYGDFGWYEYPNEEYKYMIPMYSRKSNTYKNELALTQELFKARYIDPDGPSLSSSDCGDRFQQSRLGITQGFCGHTIGPNKNIREKVPDAVVNYFYAKLTDGTVRGNNISTGIWGQFCVMSSCKHPENVIKLFDYLLSDAAWEYIANGKEGVTHEMIDGVRTPIKAPEGHSTGAGWASNMVRRKGDINYFVGIEKLEPSMLWFRPTLEKIFNISQETIEYSLDGGFTPTVSTSTAYVNYQSKMAEQITKICTGALPVSEYDNVLEGWYQAGGEQYVQEMNEHIAKTQASKAK